MSTAICSDRVLIGDSIAPGAIFFENGVITALLQAKTPAELREHLSSRFSHVKLHDYGNQVIMSGLVDNHVHINEPGNTEWEGFQTATRAAAAGGYTTIVDMPLNSIPVTTTLKALDEKIATMNGKLWCDVALLGGIVPGNADEIESMVNRGVVGFKAFMIHSGLDAFPHVSEEDIRKAMEVFKRVGRAVFMFHAEVDCNCTSSSAHPGADPKKYQTFLDSRPQKLELDAIRLVARLCKEYQVPCHIVHLSASDALEVVRQAKGEGIPLTAETTFHYLFFAAEEIPDANPLYKCCPPIREKYNRDKLWAALKEGLITQVISDHSPCTPNLKHLDSGDIMKAWGGISGVGLGLPLIWTQAKQRGFTIQDLNRWMSKQTAELVGLYGRKGSIAVGKDADFVVWNPEEQFVVGADTLHVKHKATPYMGQQLVGNVKATWLRGQAIYENAQFTTTEPQGQWVKNPSAAH